MQVTLDGPIVVEENESSPEENEEDMGIRKEDWPQIYAEIDNRVESLRPQGFKKHLESLKTWGAISALWAVPLSLLAMVITLGVFASNRITKEATFEQKTDDEYKRVDERLTAIQTSLSGLKLSVLSSQPVTRDTVDEVRRLVSTATTDGTQIDPSVVSSAGVKFVDASKIQPDAWKAATVLLDYRTKSNIEPTVGKWIVLDPNDLKNFSQYTLPQGAGPMSSVGSVPVDQAAQIFPLGEPDPNKNKQKGNELVKIHGGVVPLDGMRMRHVVIENALIRYGGGPLSLEDVKFVNCRFEMPPRPNGQLLATAIFTDPTINFAS
jgi:hypothetical protein